MYLSTRSCMYFCFCPFNFIFSLFVHLSVSFFNSPMILFRCLFARSILCLFIYVCSFSASIEYGPLIHEDFIAVFPKPPQVGYDVRMECFAYGRYVMRILKWCSCHIPTPSPHPHTHTHRCNRHQPDRIAQWPSATPLHQKLYWGLEDLKTTNFITAAGLVV